MPIGPALKKFPIASVIGLRSCLANVEATLYSGVSGSCWLSSPLTSVTLVVSTVALVGYFSSAYFFINSACLKPAGMG